MRFAEGNHAVDAAVHGKLVRPVDVDGKPIADVAAAEARGKKVYWPSTVPFPRL